jgi:Tol biopolymer transport system component
VSRSVSGGPADGASASPRISSDGRVLVFAASATNLVEGRDENDATSDIYLFRTDTGALARISVDDRGRQASRGASFAPSVSADGRYVAFASNAPLDPRDPPPRDPTADGPSTTQIYVRDTEQNTTRRITAAHDGKLPDGSSYAPVISGDGLSVAFVSHATTTNLAANDRNRTSDVFLFDSKQGSIAVISRSARGGAANGTSSAPAISADGLFVAFQSDASDIVCARRCAAIQEDINLLPDVFVYDRAANVVRKISAASGTEWMEESSGPSIDGTGTVVAFSSRHPIGETDVGHDFDLFVWVKRK